MEICSPDGGPGSKISEGGRGPKLRLHVQAADHRELIRW